MTTAYDGNPSNCGRVSNSVIDGVPSGTGSPIQLHTSASHGLFDGDRVRAFGVTGAVNINNEWIITNTGNTPTSTTSQLLTLVGSSYGGVAYAGGGTLVPFSVSPAFPIPSDGDKNKAATYNPAFQALADKIAYLATGGLAGVVSRYVPLIVTGVGNKATGFAATTQASAQVDNEFIRGRSNSAGGDAYDLAAEMPDGAIWVGFTVYSKGLDTTQTPANTATYQALSIPNNGGVSTALSGAAADAHTYGGGGNWLTTVVGTSALLTTPTVIDKTQISKRYVVQVINSGDAGLGSVTGVYGLLLQYWLPTFRPA